METVMIAMLAALVLYHSMHAIMEMKSVRYKLDKLEAKVNQSPFKEKSFKIDNVGKMMGMMIAMMGMFLVVPFFIFKTMEIPMPMLVKMSMLLILVAEIVTTMGFNTYHKRIGAVIQNVA